MTYDDLLEEQKEELENRWEQIQRGDDVISKEDAGDSFIDWVESYSYGDDDFFCTANRSDRWMDIVFPGHKEGITLCDEELRALEQMRGKIIYDYDDLIDAIHSLIDTEVDKWREKGE